MKRRRGRYRRSVEDGRDGSRLLLFGGSYEVESKKKVIRITGAAGLCFWYFGFPEGVVISSLGLSELVVGRLKPGRRSSYLLPFWGYLLENFWFYDNNGTVTEKNTFFEEPFLSVFHSSSSSRLGSRCREQFQAHTIKQFADLVVDIIAIALAFIDNGTNAFITDRILNNLFDFVVLVRKSFFWRRKDIYKFLTFLLR